MKIRNAALALPLLVLVAILQSLSLASAQEYDQTAVDASARSALPARQDPSGSPAEEAETAIGYDLATGEESEEIGGPVPAGEDGASEWQGFRVPHIYNPPPTFSDLAPINKPWLSADWKAVVRVEAEWDANPGNTFLCTGTLIDPGFVLTAGRCVFNPTIVPGWADRVRVIPAYKNGSRPFGEAQATKLWALSKWKNEGAQTHNVGWLKLDRPVGGLTGWYGVNWGLDSFYDNGPFNNPGYPRGGFDSQTMYNRSGAFPEIGTHKLYHAAQYADMKGSPALYLPGGDVYAIESHSGTGQKTGYTRLTEGKVGSIENAIANNTPADVDLVPLDFQITPQRLRAGAWPGSEAMVILNYSSTETAGDYTLPLKLYLSSDETITGADTLLADGSIFSRHGFNDRKPFYVYEVDWQGTPSIPLDTEPGTYWLGVIIEAADANPANNVTSKWDTAEIQILPPQMTASPAALSFAAVLGEAPLTGNVTVDITGSGENNPDFAWSGQANAGWLSIDPPQGTDQEQVTVTADISGLQPGTYHGRINFETDLQDSGGSPVAAAAVDVTLDLSSGDPQWTITPQTMNFEAVAGGPNPPAQGLLIDTTVDYPFNWIVEDDSAVTDDAAWLPSNSGAGTAPGIFNVAPDISGLAPGAYSTQIAAHSPGEDDFVLTTVNLTVHEAGSGEAILQVAPGSLSFAAVVGQGSPGAKSFVVRNGGSGELNWQASSAASWLSFSPAQGSGETEVSVTVNPSGLAAGTHAGVIRVTDGAGGQQVVQVVLQLRKPPTLVIDGRYLVFNGLTGQPDPPAEHFTVRNGGSGSFDWTAAENLPWLEVQPGAGTAPTQAAALAQTGGLDTGLHEGVVTVASPTALDSPQQITTRLYMRRGAVLATSPQVLAFSAVSGREGEDAKPIVIANASRGTMEWTARSSAPWLTLAQTAGTVGEFAATNVDVRVDAAALSPQDEAYVGQITVRSSNGEGGPQTITVFLNVISPARFCNIADGSTDYILNSRYAKMSFAQVENTPADDGGCDFKATLRADLPQNAGLRSEVAGHVGPDNVFVPLSSSPLVLKVATFSLELSDEFTISDEYGLKAVGANWQIPGQFGGKTRAFEGTIQIDEDGIAMSGAGTFNIPSFDYGAMRMYNMKGKVALGADWSYRIVMTGDMDIGIAGANGGADTRVKGIELTVDQNGLQSGRIGTFTIKDIAGIDIKVLSAYFLPDKLRASSAEIRIPDAWGGAEGALYGLEISKAGKVSVSGGRFKLPSIGAGGDSFKLTSLEGEFKSVAGGYEIRAAGEFGIGGLGDSRVCSLLVDVTIFSDAGASVLLIESANGRPLGGTSTASTDPLTPQALEGIRLRELTLGLWNCQPGFPIASTGFFLTGVQGTVRLRSSLEEVSLKLQIQSGATAAGVPLLSVEPQATLRPDPFFLGYQGPTYLTKAKISDTIAEFENRRFEAEMTFDFTVVHGGFGLEAGLDQNSDFYLSGSGWADVSVEKGAVFKKCVPVVGCANIPPSKWTVARADAKVNLSTISGRITVLGYGAGFKYSFASGDFSITSAVLKHLITSEQIMAARAKQADGRVNGAVGHAYFEFLDEDSLLITLPLDTAPIGRESLDTAAAALAEEVQSDVFFVLLQPETGSLEFELVDPDGRSFTSANLEANMQFAEALVDGSRQIVYSVSQARPGNWQAKVLGPVNNTDFAVFTSQNSGEGALADLALAPTGKGDEVKLSWRHMSQEATPRITLYANSEAASQELSTAGGQGATAAITTDRFVGLQVAEFANPPSDGSLQEHVVDLSSLPSGSYAFWIEAEGIAAPDVRCYIRQGGSSCDAAVGEVVRLEIDRTLSFPGEWSPAVATESEPKEGLLHVLWDELPHPDVDAYRLILRGASATQPGEEIVHTITAASPREESGRAAATFDNVEAGLAYELTITALDEESGRSVSAAPVVVEVAQPGFIVNGSARSQWVQAGGEAQKIPISLEMSDNLPHNPLLFVDYERLPHGVTVTLADETIAVSRLTGTAATISVSAGLPPGRYVVPLIARSGAYEQLVSLPIQVTAGPPAVFVPLVAR